MSTMYTHADFVADYPARRNECHKMSKFVYTKFKTLSTDSIFFNLNRLNASRYFIGSAILEKVIFALLRAPTKTQFPPNIVFKNLVYIVK
jgi:hypothetical protein